MSISNNIYGEQFYEDNTQSVSTNDGIVFIDADSDKTLMDHIMSIRKTIETIPDGGDMSIFITCGDVIPRSDYWLPLFNYIGQLATETNVNISVLFRGIMRVGMLSIFTKDVSVMVSQDIRLTSYESEMLQFIAVNPDMVPVLVSQFNNLFTGSTFVEAANAVKTLQSLKLSFDIF